MDKKELKQIIKEDKEIYYEKNCIFNLIKRIVGDKFQRIGKLIIISRKYGYYKMKLNKNFLDKIFCVIYKYRKNRLGEKLNIELGVKQFGRRLKIYHGNIVVNGYSIIGNDCELHGNNCIGNKGTMYDLNLCPIIGNNVTIGVGSNVIGKVKIGDNIKVSANSLINKSFEEGNFMIGGVPAKIIKRIGADNDKG